MSTVSEIEAAITQLEPKKIHAVADWLQEYREELWDKQIEADAKTGYRAGKPLPAPATCPMRETVMA